MVAHKLTHVHHGRWRMGHQLGRRASDRGRSNKIRRLTLVIMKQLQFLSACLICLWSSGVNAQSNKPTMKAIVAHEYGGPEGLKYGNVPVPPPQREEVRIKGFRH